MTPGPKSPGEGTQRVAYMNEISTAQSSHKRTAFEREVEGRFGILPNFFRSAQAAPDLIQQLWGFARAGYLDNPMPAVFKERLFVWLSRFCPARYCIVRHVGFLIGHGRPAGDADARAQSVAEVISLLKRPTPWARDMASTIARLGELAVTPLPWPESGAEAEDLIFACAAIVFVEPTRSERARKALLHALSPRNFELLAGFLAFVRTAHYWTVLHPEIETEEDMRDLMREHEELCRVLLEDPEAERCEMGERLFDELSALRELHERRELEHAKRKLEEKDQQKDQFIAVLAHELRNPLAAVRAAVDALGLIKVPDPRVERFLGRLDRQSAAMARMLDDLLDASRIALGKVSVHLEEIDVGKLLDDVMTENEARIRQAGLAIEFHAATTRCVVKGDRIRLRQVIDNLLSNAIKFTPAPGRITVGVRAGSRNVHVEVEDTGVGFDEALLARLFEPFVQGEQGSARPGGGLGLGLAIGSKLAELQGGRLSASSPGTGRGSVFALTLPLVTPTEEAPTTDDVQGARRNQRILVIEDNRDVADCFAELIDFAGFDANVAYDGAMGLAAALKEPPAMIICDIGLPGRMDGYAVARAFRGEPRLREIPLVAASGYGRPEDHARAKEAGFDRLIAKPITFQALRAVLGETIPAK